MPVFVNSPVHGAYNSLWATEFWVGATRGPVQILETRQCLACSPLFIVEDNKALQPSLIVKEPGDPVGVILYVRRPTAANARFNLRVQDLSRQALTWGTELPVVREGDLRTDEVVLLNIPLDDRFRQALRIYDVSGNSGSSFKVTVEEIASGTVLAEETATTAGGRFFASDFPVTAAMVEITDLRARLALPASGAVRVIVSATTPTPFWAFVTVTNNETQHVTTITPQ
ncbi:MAG TPA: hypothetical protein VGS96_07505 [Thermoanaerobaculia bacterium]|nr:hypothetical protein [Thermoanaerobaculia bacterium]